MRLGDGGVRRLGSSLVVLFVLAASLQVLVSLQNPGTDERSDWGLGGRLSDFALTGTMSLFPMVAQLIIRQKPRNRMGWLLHAVGFSWVLTSLLGSFVIATLVLRPGTVPGGQVAEVIGSGIWVPPIVLMGVFVLVLFPDGMPASPLWGRLLWLAAIDAGVAVFSTAVYPGPVTGVPVALAHNPIGITWAGPLAGIVVGISVVLLPLCIVAAAVAMIQRFRRAEGAERLQFKWLMSAGATVAALYVVALAGDLILDGGPQPGWLAWLETLSVLSFGLLPVAIGIAVTRYGLYGINALISRALTVAVLGLFITAVYVTVVAGVGALIGHRRPSVFLSVLATALVAVAFQPVRQRVQHLVNRLVYGDRATPYEVLSDFAVQMAGRYTPAELLPRLAQTLTQSLGGGQAEIWLRTDLGLVCEGAWPADGSRPGFVPAGSDPLSALAVLKAERIVLVRHRDEVLGAIAVTKNAHEIVTPAEDAMLEQVASQIGLVLRNLRLVEDLQNSRQRLVTSQDNERRRLERNLHDGAQQSLVSVALQLQLASAQTDPEAHAAGLAAASQQLRTAISELRELAHGIHPAILTERGLAPAIGSLATRCPIPVEVDGALTRRLPATIEATLYFVVAEALTNVVKYAHAKRVTLTLRDNGNAVEITVADDGVGGADLKKGTGITGLTDRLAVLHGELSLDSPPGAGTRLICRVPVHLSGNTAQPFMNEIQNIQGSTETPAGAVGDPRTPIGELQQIRPATT